MQMVANRIVRHAQKGYRAPYPAWAVSEPS